MDNWYESYKKCTWYKILFGKNLSGLKSDILEHVRDSSKEKRNREYIIENFLYAAEAMRNFPGETVDFTQLNHTASSLLLLESTRENVYRTLDWINKQILKNDHDPKGVQATEIITIAMLYFLILDAEIYTLKSRKQKKHSLIKELHQRLDERNWCVGERNMKSLDIEIKK